MSAVTNTFHPGHLVMVDIPGTSLDAATAEFLRRHHVRAICLFRRNLGTEDEIRKLTSDLREIMGPSALPKYPRDDPSSSGQAFASTAQAQQTATRVPGQAMRGAFATAQDVYGYVSTYMPLPTSSAGTLKPDEYWAVVNFMLIAHGVAVPAEGVSEANAKSINIQQ